MRVVVLTGAGERAFSTGADMKGGSGASGLEYWAAARPNGFGGIALRETLNVPVIARVNGHAAGGGFEMVLGCDIVMAAEAGDVQPAGGAGRPHAARRRHDAAAAADSVSCRHGHHAHGTAGSGDRKR